MRKEQHWLESVFSYWPVFLVSLAIIAFAWFQSNGHSISVSNGGVAVVPMTEEQQLETLQTQAGIFNITHHLIFREMVNFSYDKFQLNITDDQGFIYFKPLSGHVIVFDAVFYCFENKATGNMWIKIDLDRAMEFKLLKNELVFTNNGAIIYDRADCTYKLWNQYATNKQIGRTFESCINLIQPDWMKPLALKCGVIPKPYEEPWSVYFDDEPITGYYGG